MLYIHVKQKSPSRYQEQASKGGDGPQKRKINGSQSVGGQQINR